MSQNSIYSPERSNKFPKPPPVINFEHFQEPRSLKFLGVRDFDQTTWENEMKSLTKLMLYLNRTSLAVAGVLCICQIGAAICLCRPVVVLGGVLVSLLFLCQGILGNYVVNLISPILLVGYSCLSAFVALTGIAAAIYLLFNNFTEACISSFHNEDDPSASTRLSIVKALSLIAAVPCLLGAVACFLSATLAGKASRESPKKVFEPQLFLYLQDNDRISANSKGKSLERRNSNVVPSAPRQQDSSSNGRSCSPPPSYYQVNESFA